MTLFNLYLNGAVMGILPETVSLDPKYQILSSRDPDQPIEFKIGYVYFNPLLKNKEGFQAYLMTPAGLMGYQSGKPPVRLSKAETAQLSRGWFELPRAKLTPKDLHPQLIYLIDRTPTLVGVIAQSMRAQLGLHIPDDLKVTNANEWYAWLTTQEVPCPPSLRRILTALYINPHNLVFSRETREFMLTGIKPEPAYLVRLRWAEIKEIKIVTQQLYESMEWEITVPESIIKEGSAAVLNFADKQLGPEWHKLEKYPTGENKKETSEPETVSSAPLIFYRPEHSDQYALYARSAEPWTGAPSVIDLLSEATKKQ